VSQRALYSFPLIEYPGRLVIQNRPRLIIPIKNSAGFMPSKRYAQSGDSSTLYRPVQNAGLPHRERRTEMKRVTIGTLAVLFMLIAGAEAGNFNHFKELMEAGKFQQSEPIEGFATWKKEAIVVGIHTSMNGDCDSGTIISGKEVKPVDFYMGLKGIYFCLQWSLVIADKSSIDPNDVPERVNKLIKQIRINMENSNTNEFIFDGLAVKTKTGKNVVMGAMHGLLSRELSKLKWFDVKISCEYQNTFLNIRVVAI
jgi:hypothetical protein